MYVISVKEPDINLMIVMTLEVCGQPRVVCFRYDESVFIAKYVHFIQVNQNKLLVEST